MSALDTYLAGFTEEPGFLDYGAFGPMSAAVAAEMDWQREVLARARFGSTAALLEQDGRARAALADALGFRPDQVVLQPNTSTALMHAMFGLTGGILLSPAEFPSLPFAAVRAEQSLSVTAPIWLETDHGRVTPGQIRDQLTSTTVAVAVSLVDARTGFVADLEGIRDVIGDRVLVVDAVQGFGAVDAPLELADIVAGGGQKWLRAGWGTGYLALSDRAVERLTPVFSGYPGTSEEDVIPWDEVPPPIRAAAAFRVSGPDPLAAARLAAAVEEVTEVGIPVIAERVAENALRVIELADEYALTVVSSRDPAERAGIVVLEPDPDQLTALTAALHNQGVAVTSRQGRVRVAPHAGTTEDTFAALRAALTDYATSGRLR
ncbi:aminotransferase class V-fold PLP-dependent enzyme [Naasia sp. SYSU D00948]|uniref:aminotransferase class V-fold PLP-dependent enzyme n=1 Tax=Naasia sp. SYSU D00948 TaxID=2817379 RepID=UPI001B310A01|nr:aminotransferase class V-fold PLP-dependent enzyme [Naasia sp. SYSU D00948]